VECGCNISMLAKIGHVAQLGYFHGARKKLPGREEGGYTHSHTQRFFRPIDAKM